VGTHSYARLRTIRCGILTLLTTPSVITRCVIIDARARARDTFDPAASKQR